MEEKKQSLIDIVFSWSISDICNPNLYKGKVAEIPKTFSSTEEYLDSFKLPLIEETHADLFSTFNTLYKAPLCRIYYSEPPLCRIDYSEQKIIESEKDILIMRESFKEKQITYKIDYLNKKEDLKDKYIFYEPKVGDLVAFTEVKPSIVDDLIGRRLPFTLGLVKGQDSMEENRVYILSSNIIDLKRTENYGIHVVYLTNMITNMRIWSAINTSNTLGDSMSIIKNVLDVDPSDDHDCDSCCSVEENQSASLSLARILLSSFDLDDSQNSAVLECIVKRDCLHRNTVKLIWGPPGTGKTKTVASLLFVLLWLRCRTLTCAPTNIAVVGVASRVMGLIRDKLDLYRLGDIVLFGNKERMKINDHEELYHVFLDNRVSILSRCLAPLTGWIGSARSLISLLEEPQEDYCRFLKAGNKEIAEYKEVNFVKFKDHDEIFMPTLMEVHTILKMNKKQPIQCEMSLEEEDKSTRAISFKQFFVKKYNFLRNRLIIQMGSLYTHYPTKLIVSTAVVKMIRLVELLVSIQIDTRNEQDSLVIECVEILESLQEEMKFPECLKEEMELPECLQKEMEFPESLHEKKKFPEGVSSAVRSICMKNAVLLFCTASSSCNLQTDMDMPLELLFVDEAAQLKECESTIPLQLSGLKHAILIGDEKQLPAMVQSEISNEAKMGRSLFERMVMLGMPKHLLNIQYRMHPSISLFPNKQFYQGKILNGPNVIKRQYEKHFLEGPMFGSYSFIDIRDGIEDFGGHSSKNLVEIAVLAEIIERLYKASVASKRKISIGCISPYKAQVFAMQERLKNYDYSDFSVNVRSVDGFQGGEEDLIIISTVRCNLKGSIGFLSNCQRTNVALTRARYGLWILGNATTLINSGSIWKDLVVDAKERGCYFNASDDHNLSKSIQSFTEHDQLTLLFKPNSPLFKDAKWKVHFNNDFIHTMKKSNDSGTCKEVISLLKRISTGWRSKDGVVDIGNMDGTICSEILEMYKISNGSSLILVWSVKVVQEDSKFVQVIQVWDILGPYKIPELVKKLEDVFGEYTVSWMNRCKTKMNDGELAVPATWPADSSASDWRSSRGRPADSYAADWRSYPGRGNRGRGAPQNHIRKW